MSKKKSPKKIINATDKVQQLTYKLTFSYISLLIVCILIISIITLSKSNDTLKQNVQILTNSLNVQTKLNVESYLDNLEDTSTLIFADEINYTYDPTDPALDDKTKVLIETSISERLYELCIMENFCDYGIIYSDNTNTGKISNSTNNVLGDDMYTAFEKVLLEYNKSYAWYTGFNDDYKRIYYIKQINDNAIFISSFYNTQLKSVFKYLNYMDGMVIQLLDKHNKIIYSSNTSEIGTTISDDIVSRMGETNYTTLVDKEYILSANTCGDDWRLVTYIPTNVVLRQNVSTILYTSIVSVLISTFSIIITIIMVKSVFSPIRTLLTGLSNKAEYDQLTKLLNKQTFQSYVSQVCDSVSPTERYAFMMLDLDNFKGINDNLGHNFGDKVLSNVGDILRRNFRHDLCGRLGGDEFAIFMKIPSTYNYDVNKYVIEKCTDVCTEFNDNYTGQNHDYKVSASIGVSVFPNDAMTFSELYSFADSALYKSKHKGKDTFTIYSQLFTDEEGHHFE